MSIHSHSVARWADRRREMFDRANRVLPVNYLRWSVMLLLCVGFAATATAQKKQRVELLHANTLEYDGDGAKKLIGNVGFLHEGVRMYCDSAYLWDDQNLESWGNVRINQGDSMRLFGDSLFYNAETKLARVRGDIRMETKDFTLTTNYLNYDREREMSWYLGGGHIVGKKDNTVLDSDIGYFYPKDNHFFFKDSVVMVNPEYRITSDTLMYNTASEVTWFYGPSYIKNKNNTIYCENGFYNTVSGFSRFSENSWILSGRQRIEGDSIEYNENEGIGEAWRNVAIIDSSQNVKITGDYTIYHEKDSISMVTGHALLAQKFNNDSLFLHSDSMFVTSDTAGKRILLAYNKVKFFTRDMQGKCDSLVFSDADSTIRMFVDPIIWSEENQITGDSIIIKNYDGKVRWMKMRKNAFIISEEDTVRYNQIKGKNMFGHFSENELRRVDVNGNGQTIYFPRDDGEIFAMNRADCSNMIIRIDSQEVRKLTFLTEPKATLFPIEDVKKDELYLENYAWFDELRPRHKLHVFYWDTIPDSLKYLRPEPLRPDSFIVDTVSADSAQTDSVVPVQQLPQKPKGSKKDKLRDKGKKTDDQDAPEGDGNSNMKARKDEE